MSKLTKAQKRMLRSVADGAVHLHFDVYGGYWWTEYGKRLAAFGNGKSDNWPPLPIRALLEAKLITKCDLVRLASGRHLTAYATTKSGRAALAESSK